MPELPEVETIRRQLAPLLAERTIVDAAADANPKFTAAPAAIGGTVTGVDRRGKYLLVGLDHADGPRELVVHLGMTGQLGADIDPGGPHVRAWWGFADGGTLGYRDVRQFGRIAVVPAGRYETLGTLGRIGPEPLSDSFTPAGLWEGLHRRRARVKTVLLGQQVVAGVGNIYADEALWRAGIHPAARRVGRERAAALHAAIRAVLAEGIEHGGTTLRDYRTVTGEAGRNQTRLDCYGRAGEPCRRCGTTLRHAVFDGRGTTWCPACQPR